MADHIHGQDCEDAEARIAALETALAKAREMIPVGYTDCQGWKCRQLNCEACFGELAEAYDIGFINELLPVGSQPSGNSESVND